MKLYEVWVCNGMHYDDEYHYTEITVAENEQQALKKVIESESCYFRDYHSFESEVRVLDVVDGYKINLTPSMKNEVEEQLESIINDLW